MSDTTWYQNAYRTQKNSKPTEAAVNTATRVLLITVFILFLVLLSGFWGRKSEARPIAFMEFGSVPSCGGIGGGRTRSTVVNVGAESGSLGLSHSPQKRHLTASWRICSLQNGQTLNVPTVIRLVWWRPVCRMGLDLRTQFGRIKVLIEKDYWG